MEPRSARSTHSIVDHVRRRRRELGIPLDDLLHSVEKVLLGHGLAARTNRKHAGLGADRADFGAGRVGAQTREQLPSNVLLARDGLLVNLEKEGQRRARK